MRVKEIHLIAAFLTVLLTLFPRSAPAEELRLIWADDEKDGNPVYLSRLGEDGWETGKFLPAASFTAGYAPCLGIAPDKTSWVVWAACADTAVPAIYYSRKPGDLWSEPRRVDASSGRWECTPAIAFDQAGNPAVAWSGIAGGSTEIFCARWAGDGFGPAVMVSTPDDSPDSSPSIAPDGEGSLLVVWEGWSGGFSQVFKSRLTGGEWTPEEIVDPRPGSDQILPAARETGFGRTEIAWREDGENVTAEGGKTVRGDADRGLAGALSGAGAPDPGSGAWLLRENGDGTWGAYRYRALLPPPPEKEASWPPRRGSATDYYIGYGDSITYGHSGGSNTSGWYGSLLAAMLPALYPGLSFYFYNKGYPGAETHDLLLGGGEWGCPGINSVISSHPAATKILIMGGTNDISHGVYYTVTQFNLGEMIDRARNNGVEPMLATIIPRDDEDVYFIASWQLSDYYISPLADEKDCLLADPFNVYMSYYDTPYFDSLYESDKVHPKWQQGDQEIANAWFSAFAAPGGGGPPAGCPGRQAAGAGGGGTRDRHRRS
ncbi:MAG: GDSL-type esterase/lipase family protein, partial [PVC group bacterium]